MRLTIVLGALAGLAACDASMMMRGPDAATRAAASPAESACVSTVESRTGAANVGVVGSEVGPAGTSVTVAAGPQGARWQCAVSIDGLVVESVTML